jgi:hypothetical protein
MDRYNGYVDQWMTEKQQKLVMRELEEDEEMGTLTPVASHHAHFAQQHQQHHEGEGGGGGDHNSKMFLSRGMQEGSFFTTDELQDTEIENRNTVDMVVFFASGDDLMDEDIFEQMVSILHVMTI